jgi:cell wall-associated NlpC family hydrolase
VISRVLVFAIVALAVAGCRSLPPGTAPPGQSAAVPPADPGTALAGAAERLVGAPYRFGGASPEGFDCSGLVLYTHGRMGLSVPRTAAEQQRAARPVQLRELAPGDVVFFRIGGATVDHVGVYVGGGRFVHAPRSGRPVISDALDDPFYERRFAGAGRFWSPSAAGSAGAAAP